MEIVGTNFGTYFRVVDNTQAFRVSVRGRPFLAGSGHPAVPENVPDIGSRLQIIEPVTSSASLLEDPVGLRTCRQMIDERLSADQGVLLRNFELQSRAEFEAFVRAIGYRSFGYKGGIAVRQQESRASMNASDEDPRITLTPHNEMSYLNRYPSKIIFYCDTQAESGGEVPVNDIRDSLAFIPDEIRNKLERLGIRYYRVLPRNSEAGQVGWGDTFDTESQAEIEEHMRQSGYDYEWVDGDRLKYSYRRPAILPHPETGEALWFNQITELNSSYWRDHPHFASDLPEDAYPATTSYGDGSPIDPETIALLRAALWRSAYAVRMQRYDLLILDNQIMQHGRFAYEGYRRHYVCMAA